jgi:hypothetical protein
MLKNIHISIRWRKEKFFMNMTSDDRETIVGRFTWYYLQQALLMATRVHHARVFVMAVARDALLPLAATYACWVPCPVYSVTAR